MANVNTTTRPTATIESSNSPVIYNVTCASNAVEYSQALTANAKKFFIKTRSLGEFRVAFVSGDTSITWLTVPPGCSFNDNDLKFNGTLYFKCTANNEIIEILEWS